MSTFEEVLGLAEYFCDNYFDEQAENEFFVILNACYGSYLL